MFMVVDISFWSFTLVSRCFRFSSRSFHTVSRTPPSRVHPFNYQASFLSCKMQKYFHMRVRLSSLMFCTYWILKYTTRAWQQSPRSTAAQLNAQQKKQYVWSRILLVVHAGLPLFHARFTFLYDCFTLFHTHITLISRCFLNPPFQTKTWS